MGAPVPAAIHYPQMLDLWRPSRSRVPGRGLGTRTALRSRGGGREVGWDGWMGEVLSSKGSPWWGPSSGEGLGSLSCRQSVVTTASSRITLSQEKAQGKGRQSGEEERLARAAFPRSFPQGPISFEDIAQGCAVQPIGFEILHRGPAPSLPVRFSLVTVPSANRASS